MNIIEAANLMQQGYKIRLKRWAKSTYIYDSDGLVRDNENNESDQLSTDDILSDHWEVYTLSPIIGCNFTKALKALRQGNIIKRNLWTRKTINPIWNDDSEINFTIDDFEANDWVILEKVSE